MFERIQAWDDRVLMCLSKKHSPVLNKIMIFITTTGNNGYIWFAFSIPFLLMNKWRITGLTILLGMGIASLTGEITIKHIVKRIRPCNKAFEEYLLIKNPPHYSFPSGHTSASFAVTAVVFYMCPMFFVPVVMYAALLAFSRVYLLVHYPSDVIAGIFIGSICGMVAIPVSPYIPFFAWFY